MKKNKEEKTTYVVASKNALLFLGEDDEEICLTDVPGLIKKFPSEEEADKVFQSLRGKNILFLLNEDLEEEQIKACLPLKVMSWQDFVSLWYNPR